MPPIYRPGRFESMRLVEASDGHVDTVRLLVPDPADRGAALAAVAVAGLEIDAGFPTQGEPWRTARLTLPSLADSAIGAVV